MPPAPQAYSCQPAPLKFLPCPGRPLAYPVTQTLILLLQFMVIPTQIIVASADRTRTQRRLAFSYKTQPPQLRATPFKFTQWQKDSNWDGLKLGSSACSLFTPAQPKFRNLNSPAESASLSCLQVLNICQAKPGSHPSRACNQPTTGAVKRRR